MRVTRIEECSKSRVRIFLDEEFAFALYKGELRSFGVCEGEELDGESFRAITEEVLPRRAKLRVMNLLQRREYTVQQLRDKLRAGGYPDGAIEEAMAYVAGCRYTDDLRYAANFIRRHEGSRSRRRMEQDLLGRGIDRRTIERAWAEWEAEGRSRNEQEVIRALLAKKGYEPQGAEVKERQRMYRFLVREGFSGEQARKAVFAGDCGEQ